MSDMAARYPLDRYLVDSSKKFEMINIIDDELWNTEPALKPEDELILRKLHEMLQSTADDLKLLSGELSKFHQPGVQVKTTPTPLDDEFNEKVHIEDIVNAKFHGYKIINKPTTFGETGFKPSNDVTKNAMSSAKIENFKTCNNNEMKTKPIIKKSLNKNLGITRTKVIEIKANPTIKNCEKLNNGKVVNVPVAYKEYSFNYVQPKVNTIRKDLKLQEMPRINIRSELKEQKVFQLDIMPDKSESDRTNATTKNVAVIALQHESVPTTSSNIKQPFKPISHYPRTKPIVRKISKMSTCESSGSTNNISSDTLNKFQTQKRLVTIDKARVKKKYTQNDNKKINPKKELEKRSPCLEEWRKKLDILYGPSTSKSRPKTKSKSKISPKNPKMFHNSRQSIPNNSEYIPYSKLTIGGVRASDIEKEISTIPNKNNIPLSPFLDKILSSRENSFSKSRKTKPKTTNSLKIMTTSDENLLQEVIDIERTVSETLSKNLKSNASETKSQKTSSDTEEAKDNESYIDDFEEEKSDHSGQSENREMRSRSASDSDNVEENNIVSDNDDAPEKQMQSSHPSSTRNTHILTRSETSKLSFKHKIDIFEYVHAVDTQDSATQSNVTQKITPKETQTTPRSDNNVQPIHNDLWPSMDPNGSVEKMFQLEKEFIKKFIVDEYGDILEKNITKASTSKDLEITNNVAALQKNTQTSPAHVKNVMTSPRRTKTRTTSPFTTFTIDHHTSPLIFVSNEEDVKVEMEDDLAISINLSSPRFSLRLPRNSREVISNMGDSSRRINEKSGRKIRKSASSEAGKSNLDIKKSTVETKQYNPNITTTSSSSIEADSSEISSLGEVRLRRMLAKTTNNSDSESLCSISSKYSSDLQSGILPLRSEGEMSVGVKKKSFRHNKSEGEASFGLL